MTIIVVLLTVFFGVFSGSGPDAEVEPPAPTGTTTPDASTEPFPDGLGPLRGDEAIEQRFLTRYPLPTCDFVYLPVRATVEQRREALSCLQAAADAGEGAELVAAPLADDRVSRYVYYRANPDGPLEIFTDLRADDARRQWDYRRCEPSPDIAEEPCA